jgi:hypothetical protein
MEGTQQVSYCLLPLQRGLPHRLAVQVTVTWMCHADTADAHNTKALGIGPDWSGTQAVGGNCLPHGRHSVMSLSLPARLASA